MKHVRSPNWKHRQVGREQQRALPASSKRSVSLFSANIAAHGRNVLTLKKITDTSLLCSRMFGDFFFHSFITKGMGKCLLLKALVQSL